MGFHEAARPFIDPAASLNDGIEREVHVDFLFTIPQSATPPAPFTQGSLFKVGFRLSFDSLYIRFQSGILTRAESRALRMTLKLNNR